MFPSDPNHQRHEIPNRRRCQQPFPVIEEAVAPTLCQEHQAECVAARVERNLPVSEDRQAGVGASQRRAPQHVVENEKRRPSNDDTAKNLGVMRSPSTRERLVGGHQHRQ